MNDQSPFPRLSVTRQVHADMLAAARRAAPLEACGLCGGRDGQATACYELANADASAEHFRMLPEEQFAAVKDMRAKGMEMVAIWHCHPATPARMSAEDLRLAFTPDTVFLILSLATPTVPELRGFIVRDGEPVPVAIAIIDEPEGKTP